MTSKQDFATPSRQDLDRLFKVGQLAYQRGDYTRAVAAFSTLVKGKSRTYRIKASMGLVRVHMAQQNWPAAIALCQKIETSRHAEVRQWAETTRQKIEQRNPQALTTISAPDLVKRPDKGADLPPTVPPTVPPSVSEDEKLAKSGFQPMADVNQPSTPQSGFQPLSTSVDNAGNAPIDELIDSSVDQLVQFDSGGRSVRSGSSRSGVTRSDRSVHRAKPFGRSESAEPAEPANLLAHGDIGHGDIDREDSPDSPSGLSIFHYAYLNGEEAEPTSDAAHREGYEWSYAGRLSKGRSLGKMKRLQLWLVQLGGAIAFYFLGHLLIAQVIDWVKGGLNFLDRYLPFWVGRLPIASSDITWPLLIGLGAVGLAAPWLWDLGLRWGCDRPKAPWCRSARSP